MYILPIQTRCFTETCPQLLALLQSFFIADLRELESQNFERKFTFRLDFRSHLLPRIMTEMLGSELFLASLIHEGTDSNEDRLGEVRMGLKWSV